MIQRSPAFFLVASIMATVIAFVGCRPAPGHLSNSAPPPTTSESLPSKEPATTSTPTQSNSPTISAELKVHFIDVGQGDSILIDLGQTELLIDGGEKSPGVTSYIGEYVDGPLEAIVATHPHADHIGGLIEVLKDFDVSDIWTNGESSTSKTYSQFMNAAQAERADIHLARRGDTINVGTLSFEVLNPANLGGTTNNNSIVLSLKYGNVDFLFMGDAEKEAEASMLSFSAVLVPDVEVLKVGHHGSRTASSLDFLSTTTPEVAVYMAGRGNTYGHPHKETIANLCRIGAQVYGTDVHGDIVVTTNGMTYQVLTDKTVPSITDAHS